MARAPHPCTPYDRRARRPHAAPVVHNCVEHARRDAGFAAERRLVRLRRATLGLNPRVQLALQRAIECGHRVERLGVAGRQVESCLRRDCIRPPTPAGSCDCANRIDKKMQSKPVHTDVIGVTHGSPQLTWQRRCSPSGEELFY